MIVLDASAVVDLVLGTRDARAIAARIASAGFEIHAPHLIDLEVAQVLRRIEREDLVVADRVADAIHAFGDLTIQRHAHEPMLARIWRSRGHVTAYDAAYISLAEALDAVLLTRDKKLARSTGHEARIEVI